MAHFCGVPWEAAAGGLGVPATRLQEFPEMQLEVGISRQLCSRTLSHSVDFKAAGARSSCHLFTPRNSFSRNSFPFSTTHGRELTVPVPSILTARSPPRGHLRGGQQTLLTFPFLLYKHPTAFHTSAVAQPHGCLIRGGPSLVSPNLSSS